jgi:hypothetical protein
MPALVHLLGAVVLAGCRHSALRALADAAVPADGKQVDAALPDDGRQVDAPRDEPIRGDASGGGDSPSLADADARSGAATDATLPDACVPVTCSRGDTDYCGTICDGCGGTLDCPAACGWGRVCDVERAICGRAACAPLSSCVGGDGSRYCGLTGDGCAGVLSCGECPTGETCEAHVCSGGSSCRRLSCTLAPPYQEEQYCGTIDDCCGGVVDCGSCHRIGWQCVNHVCDGSGLAVCLALTCRMAGYTYCGSIGDGCGGALDCPAECPEPGWICRAHLCVGLPGSCSAVTCAAAGRQRFCGQIGDGCGGLLDCGACPAGEACTSTGNCRPSNCDGGCATADPLPPRPPAPPPAPPLRYQCPVPAPVGEAPILPPACPQQ